MIDHSKCQIDTTIPGLKCLCLKGGWSDDIISLILTEGINAIRLSLSNGWNDSSIRFVHNIPECIISFEIYKWDIDDITPLYKHENIERLSIQANLKKAFDVSIFKSLKNLRAHYVNKIINISSAKNLESINVTNHPEENVALYSSLIDLKEIAISSRKLCDISDVRLLKNLSVLDFADCPKLYNLIGIEYLHALSALKISSCTKIDYIPPLSGANKLKLVAIDNCKSLRDINFLAGNKNVEEVMITGCPKVKSLDQNLIDSLSNLKRIRVNADAWEK